MSDELVTIERSRLIAYETVMQVFTEGFNVITERILNHELPAEHVREMIPLVTTLAAASQTTGPLITDPNERMGFVRKDVSDLLAEGKAAVLGGWKPGGEQG